MSDLLRPWDPAGHPCEWEGASSGCSSDWNFGCRPDTCAAIPPCAGSCVPPECDSGRSLCRIRRTWTVSPCCGCTCNERQSRLSPDWRFVDRLDRAIHLALRLPRHDVALHHFFYVSIVRRSSRGGREWARLDGSLGIGHGSKLRFPVSVEMRTITMRAERIRKISR